MARSRRRRIVNPYADPAAFDEDGIDAMFGGITSKASDELGTKDISVGSAADVVCIGLPVPALSLRHLFQSTVFPLGRIVQITGEEGSCKTAFLMEIFRWHFVYGGGGAYHDNESKDSPEWRNSILAWNPRWIRRCEVVPTFSLEEWMTSFTTFGKLVRMQQDDPNGPGRVYPYAMGVDSLMSTAPEETIAKTVRDGHSSRGFALAALLISSYMKTMPAQIGQYPFTIIGTNHLKPSTDFMGRPTANIPGGKAVKFMETYEIEMHKAPRPDIDLVDYGGLRLRLVCRKNAVGPSRKQIVAELLWWQEEVQGMMRQQTAWDWDTASIELLLAFDKAKGKKTLYNRLMDVCDLHVASKSSRLVWSNVLGIPRTDPVHYRQAGALLEQHPEVLSQLYPLLGITTRPEFRPGVDFREQMRTAQESGAGSMAHLYDAAPSMPVTAEGGVGAGGAVLPDEDAQADPGGDGGAANGGGGEFNVR